MLKPPWRKPDPVGDVLIDLWIKLSLQCQQSQFRVDLRLVAMTIGGRMAISLAHVTHLVEVMLDVTQTTLLNELSEPLGHRRFVFRIRKRIDTMEAPKPFVLQRLGVTIGLSPIDVVV